MSWRPAQQRLQRSLLQNLTQTRPRRHSRQILSRSRGLIPGVNSWARNRCEQRALYSVCLQGFSFLVMLLLLRCLGIQSSRKPHLPRTSQSPKEVEEEQEELRNEDEDLLNKGRGRRSPRPCSLTTCSVGLGCHETPKSLIRSAAMAFTLLR